MQKKIELCIFTNTIVSAPSTKIIRQCYNSFVNCFEKIEPKVFCDSNPRKNIFNAYKNNLQNNFKTVIETISLSGGYIKAVLESKAEYIFMLEGDWIFKKELILNSLDEIINLMQTENIYHLRFNKRKNESKLWDKNIVEKKSKINYCITPVLSNNPHIIKRKKALEFIKNKYIKVEAGSKGIEEHLTKRPELWGAIYGGLNYPATVKHLDGKLTI